MENWYDEDLFKTASIKNYTLRSAYKMNKQLDSEKFRNMDVETIYDYLLEGMEVVSFKDHLKRSLYVQAQIEMPFSDVPDEYYMEIIDISFSENSAPFTFTPTERKKNSIIKGWLKAENVKRESIFVLGFGLGMTDEEVSLYLKKVIQEQDFNFMLPEETIFWYCFHKNLKYRVAKNYLDRYDNDDLIEVSERHWNDMADRPLIYLINEQQLLQYLYGLKHYSGHDFVKENAQKIVNSLYDRAREAVIIGCQDYYDDNEKGIVQTINDVTPSDLEHCLYSGVPISSNGNLLKMSESLLNGQLQNKRLTRQRITGLLKGKIAVTRTDIITLLFFIYAITVEPDWPGERFIQYIDEVNELLAGCGMYGIYPVNPYETFILMCIQSIEPLDVYNEIWEKSYMK